MKKTIIQNPIDVSKLPSIYNGKRRKRIVNFSRLVSQKNHKMLIEAFRLIVKKHPEYELALYGDGPMKNDIKKTIGRYGLDDKIKLYPATSNIYSEVNKDSVFVLTSNYEGFPNSLLEAMAMGIPSISTNCRIGGPNDMIDDGENGFLVNVNDYIGLYEKILLLIEDEELQRSFHDAYKEIRKRYSIGLISSKWYNFLEEVVNESR